MKERTCAFWDRLRLAAGSIRGQFVLFFFIGSLFLLALSAYLSYNAMHGTVRKINERTTSSEFAQISVNLQNVLGNINRQMDVLIQDASVKTLQSYDRHSELELIHATNDFSREVTAMIRYYPYIHSVYLYLDEARVLCATSINMQRFVYDWYPGPGDAIREKILSYTGRSLRLAGGLTDRDFPLLTAEAREPVPLVSTVRYANGGWIVINILEDYFSSLYLGLSSSMDSTIRLVDAGGAILSAWDKEELGAGYAYGDRLDALRDGAQFTDSRQRMQVLWHRLDPWGLFITNEISLGVYWRDLSGVVATVLLAFVLGLAVLCTLFLLWMNRAFAPLKALAASMGHVGGTGEYDSPIALPAARNDEMAILVGHYNRMLASLKELTYRQQRAEAEKRESELRALRNQINPHFLFNTLNNIKWMSIVSGVPDIAKSISALGGIIQPLYRSNAPGWTLREELEVVRLYLQIMNTRYEGGIGFTQSVPPELEAVTVLRFIVQPLIENAIAHGFAGRQNRGDISLGVYQTEGCLKVTIADNGRGLSGPELDALNERLAGGAEGGGIGLINTARRIELRYGRPYGIVLSHNPGGGLRATLSLPLDAEAENTSA